MAKKKRLRRPSTAMMAAVNAAIDRKDQEVAALIKEHDLDPAELEQRLILRDGKQYDLNGSSRRPGRERRPRASQRARAQAVIVDLDVTVDGRTSVAKLYRLMEAAERLRAQAQQELQRRPADEVEPVKKAFAEMELLRREKDKLEQKMLAMEQALT